MPRIHVKLPRRPWQRAGLLALVALALAVAMVVAARKGKVPAAVPTAVVERQDIVVTGHEPDSGVHFIPDARAFDDLASADPGAWALDAARPRERYAPAYARSIARSIQDRPIEPMAAQRNMSEGSILVRCSISFATRPSA